MCKPLADTHYFAIINVNHYLSNDYHNSIGDSEK